MMSWRRPTVTVALVAGAVFASNASSGEMSTALAIISIEPRDGGIEIAASALALTAAELKGEVVISRKGSSGTVSTRQSRNLDLAAGETDYIARTGVSFGQGDELEVRVTLKDGDVLVAESSVMTHGD